MAKLSLIVVNVLLLTFLFGDVSRSRALEANFVKLTDEASSPSEDTDRARNFQSQSIAKLCSQETASVEVDEFHRLRDRLAAGVNDKEELSRLDAAVVQARHDCSLTPHNGHALVVTDLMGLLAANWKQQGNLGRADQLYQEAYEILHETDNPIPEMGILQDWANLKLAAGEPQRAIEITKLRTTEARKEYETGRSAKEVSSIELIAALKFQAMVFDKVGLADEAHAAKQEADQLSAQQKPCFGLCGLTIRKVD
jgi:tetratricopeptide (TPR) repeat protein